VANSAFTPTAFGTSTSSSAFTGINYLSSHFAADSLGTVTLSVGDTLSSSTRSNPSQWGTSAASAIIAQSTDSSLRGTTNYLVSFTTNGQFVESPLFTLDGSDLGKALQVSFTHSGVSTSDDVQAYIVRYNSSNVLQERIPLAGTASATAPFSARLGTGVSQMNSFFVSGSTASDKYALRILRNANATAVRLDSFSIGPQSIGVGAAITDWYLDTNFTVNGFGTVSNQKIWRKQVGDTMFVKGSFTCGAPSASPASISLPTGFSIDSTKVPSNTDHACGWFERLYGTSTTVYNSGYNGVAFVDVGTTDRIFYGIVNATSKTDYFKSNGNDIAISGDNIDFYFTIPISQWASSNFQTADRAVEEYASNDGSGGTAANNTYNTGMQYGLTGSQFVSVASTTATSTTRYLVRFQQAIQPTDKIFIEVYNSSSGEWADISYWSRTGIKPILNQNDSFYGMGWEAVGPSTPTDIYVAFGNKGRNTSTTAGAGFGANGQAWADIAGSSSYKWRVRKVSGGASVGYPVSSANVVGRTDGNAPASGMIGEIIEGQYGPVNQTASNGTVNGASISLTPGRWLVTHICNLSRNGATSSNFYLNAGISVNSASTTGTSYNDGSLVSVETNAGTANYVSCMAQRVVNLTSTTTYYGVIQGPTYSAGTPQAYGVIRAVRIA